LPLAWNILFYCIVTSIVLASELPPLRGPVSFLRDQLFSGNHAAFRAQDPGIFFSAFAPFLPARGRISFITDLPYAPRDPATELIQRAQGRLAPLILNPEPVERMALVFCSNSSIAEARMKAASYRPVRILGDGKIIAVKNP
jgi:hypothetical protein